VTGSAQHAVVKVGKVELVFDRHVAGTGYVPGNGMLM
jgi:hypothetical protein